MAKSIKGTQTEKNLLAAFAGESQARNRYTFFASAARKEGFEQISAIFLDTAENEKEHAKLFFQHLEGGDAEITATYPAGITKTTLENLQAAAAGEKLEWTTLYKDFGKIAADEGFPEVSKTFNNVARVEVSHEARYRKLIENISNKTVFTKPSSVKWRCRNCGLVLEGAVAPEKCPTCDHPKAHFEILAENY